MEEAQRKKSFLQRLRRGQKGQALIEYILILMISIVFLRMIYFNKDFGFKASLDKMMLRLGSFLEQNLKTGTQIGPTGKNSLDAYAGTSQWTN